jgi:hypothetical protein
VTYDPTGDPGLDLFTGFIGKLGIAVDHPAMKAMIDDGNFDLLKGHLAALGDKAKGWEQHVALAEKAHGEIAAIEAQEKGKVAAAIHNVVGGEQNWTTIQAWASKEASPAEKTAINAMLNGGTVQARAAAMLLQSLYDNASGVVRNPADPTNGLATNRGQPAQIEPLTRRAAVAETNKLTAKFGSYGIEQRPEYKAIWARVR